MPKFPGLTSVVLIPCLHQALAHAHLALALAAKKLLHRIQQIEPPPLVLLLSRELRRAHR